MRDNGPDMRAGERMRVTALAADKGYVNMPSDAAAGCSLGRDCVKVRLNVVGMSIASLAEQSLCKSASRRRGITRRPLTLWHQAYSGPLFTDGARGREAGINRERRGKTTPQEFCFRIELSMRNVFRPISTVWDPVKGT
jgi:hypothetical protein